MKYSLLLFSLFSLYSFASAQWAPKILPSFYLYGVAGNKDLPEHFEHAGHDPHDKGVSLQSMELGATLYFSDTLQGFIVSNNFYDREEDSFESELEEAYIRFSLPSYNLLFKAGRQLAGFGLINGHHLHSWDFVNAPLFLARFLGDDGLAFEGANLTWTSTSINTQSISFGGGRAVGHHHEHGASSSGHNHAEEHEHALLAKELLSMRYQLELKPNDFHHVTFGASALFGRNDFEKNTLIYGVDAQYIWREKGLESGGKSLVLSLEWLSRHAATDEEEDIYENALSATILAGLDDQWFAGIRYDYLEGDSTHEIARRQRISPSLTRRFSLGNGMNALLRFQCDYDIHEEEKDSTTLWLQVGFDWSKNPND